MNFSDCIQFITACIELITALTLLNLVPKDPGLPRKRKVTKAEKRNR